LNTKLKILLTAELDSEVLGILEKEHHVFKYGRATGLKARLSEEDMLTYVAEHDPDILVVGADPVTKDILDAGNSIRLVACTRGTPVNVDVESCTRRNIPVTNTPARNAVAVAEFTIALLLCCARTIPQAHLAVKTNDITIPPTEEIRKDVKDVIWIHPALTSVPFMRFRGIEIEGAVLGIVGFGAIGRKVAQKAHALGMDVMVHDPYVDEGVFEEHHAEKTNLDSLLTDSDFISLHAKVTAETKHLIGAAEFARMKNTAYLVNTARGVLVDHKALYDALKYKEIAGAALDVFEYEPLYSDDPLLTLDNVILTPHLGGASYNVVSHHSRMILDDIVAVLENKEIPHLVNKSLN
jgi:D-3-phosphoglycerate dehydrogenase